jgi:hypothetical protein
LLWSGRRSRSSEIYVRASVDHIAKAELLHDRHGLARAAATAAVDKVRGVTIVFADLRLELTCVEVKYGSTRDRTL